MSVCITSVNSLTTNIGTVCCFNPGVQYPPLPVWAAVLEDIVDAQPGRHLSINGDDMEAYLINLEAHGGGYLDSHPSVLSAEVYSHKCASSPPPPPNPLAIGHIINHPPRGGYANLITKNFLWEDTYRAKASLDPLAVESMPCSSYLQLCPTR